MKISKRKKVRAPSFWWLWFLEGAEDRGVNILESECYMALQTVGIDAVYTDLFRSFVHKIYDLLQMYF